MTYGHCAFHERECDYKGSCFGCPHNTESTVETIERDYCPRCKYYIDKQFIYKDGNIQRSMGTVKECKFRTNTSWICEFKEVEE